MKFAKPARTLDQQIDQLIDRGMRVDDRPAARHYLLHINYYRLSGYWLPFETDHDRHVFRAGTRFEDVLNVYVFDRAFRLLLLDAIERVEVSVRANWAYYMAHAHDPHAYLNAGIGTPATYPRFWIPLNGRTRCSSSTIGKPTLTRPHRPYGLCARSCRSASCRAGSSS